MESPNAPPAHDFFTPAWLKLPDPKTSSSVSPSSQSTDSSVKRFSNSYNNSSQRKELNNSTNSLSNCLVESRDRINSYDDSQQQQQQHSPQHYLSSRHNSFGSEQQFNKPNPQVIGNNVNGFRNKKYTESIGRPPFRTVGYREKSVGYHSNQIHKINRNTDTFKPNFNSIKKSYNKTNDYSLDNESQDKNVDKEENCNNPEFPPLVNEVNSGQNIGANDNSSNNNAWSSNSASKSKVLSSSKNYQLIHSSVSNFDNIENSTKSELNGATSSKLSISSAKFRNISLMGKAKGGIMKENAIYSRIQPMLSKSSAQTTTPAMEILVKNPKKRSNKSDFLNSIRNDQNKDQEFDKHCEQKLEKLEISSKTINDFDSESDQNSGQNEYSMAFETDVKNAQNINNQYFRQQSNEMEDMGVLSSSLEAEHRLLMEWGWKAEPDDDDPSYAPLTEDEVKEFLQMKDLINTRNGINGYKRNTTSNTTHPSNQSNQTIQMNSSPLKWTTSDDVDEESTSSSDDE